MPFKELKFCYNWRNYQKEFLDNFEKHIDDNHLHVIAPPGSGKTILGIEVMCRLNKRTLILAPTLTIRNQWYDRLKSFFDENNKFDSLSFDIKSPSDVILETYQGLHSFYKKSPTKEEYFNYFLSNNIEVIVLDEAHHLKNEWWKCLYELKELHKQTIVALTATPPYDSEAIEVNKYFKLCGDIDDEIVVPDLVKEGDLCPHQDFIYFSKPNDFEINFITNYRLKIASFVNSLEKNEELIRFVQKHRFLEKTSLFANDIYINPEYFSSLLIFLNHCKKDVPKSLFLTLGFDDKEEFEIPSFDLKWTQVFLQNILVLDRKNLEEDEVLLESLEQSLKRVHGFENNQVDFVGSKSLYRYLSNSVNKLESITSILKFEQECLQDDLRAVVLTDYIKKEFLELENNDISEINKIGVVPIFHFLKRNIPKQDIAILTGSLVVIHKSLREQIEKDLSVTFSHIDFESDFLKVNEKSTSNELVNYITNLFEKGEVKVLIGTKSLLGEGWDAPSINTLILASFVGSFVSSNQMRGRAIRTQKNNLEKTGNIWHLVSLDPTDELGGKDIETLSKRFNSYVGISNQKPIYIESGIDRLHLPSNFKDLDIDEFNKEVFETAQKRNQLKENWNNAILRGSSLTREIKQYYQGNNPFKFEKNKRFKDVVRNSTIELTIGLSLFLPQFLLKNLNLLLTKGFLFFIYSLLTSLGLTFGYKSYKAIKSYIQFGYLHKDLEKISRALLDAMLEKEYILTKRNEIELNTILNSEGDVITSIKGVSNYESTIFINALEEIILPIQNPRYLLIKTNVFRKQFNVENYYSVPEIFGDKKENCLVFEKNWKRWVGDSKIIFTRNIHGRKGLLKARLFHVSNSGEKTTKKAVIWS